MVNILCQLTLNNYNFITLSTVASEGAGAHLNLQYIHNDIILLSISSHVENYLCLKTLCLEF